jgi:hypothetical protein
MGIGDNIAGIMVRKVADLQKRDRDGKVQQQLRNRSGAGKSFDPKTDQKPDIPQNDTGALEEADRMLQEIKDMVQAAASERDAARSHAAFWDIAAEADLTPNEAVSPHSSDTGDVDARTKEPDAPKTRIGLSNLPSKTFAQARALYFQNMESSVPEGPPPEGLEAADAEAQVEQPAAKSGMPDREGVGTVIDLVI